MIQEFWIEVIPKPQLRPKIGRHGRFAHIVDRDENRMNKATIIQQIVYKHPQMVEGPVKLIVDFMMPRPKSHYGKKGLKEKMPYYHTSKPDLDNLLKIVKDAITETGRIWKDDSQVCITMATKKYTEVPGIKIYIQEAS